MIILHKMKKKPGNFTVMFNFIFRFIVNFGQQESWYSPPQGFNYVMHQPGLVRGMEAPAKKSDCEVRLWIY